MKTEFTSEQLADPATATSAGAIRACVHCGFCTATCPTYVLNGDERDSPRGRIYLMKAMLETGAAPTPDVVRHIDRCLTCLGCVTTCPSGVDYLHLVEHARAHIETTYQRPLRERLLRWTIAKVLPWRRRFALALRLGRLAAPLTDVLQRSAFTRPLATMLELAQENAPRPAATTDAPCAAQRRGRVIVQQGCAEPVLRPEFRAAAVRLLNRTGYDVRFAPGEGCCGALVHHMGREAEGLGFIRRNVDVWSREIDAGGIDAILVTASGCGATIKDYGFLLRNDPAYAARAARISALAKDISELLDASSLPPRVNTPPIRVAYHAACSLQHGQKIVTQPKHLLEAAGFSVVTPTEAHMCCGSAGAYSILQPEIADRLGARKTERLEALSPDVIATGNIGCAVHIGARSHVPVVHVVELLDWATGGPAPAALKIGKETGTHAADA
ncbi:MAG: glycolate oxidase subunit GlcF [Alphaproteobacteria bacterium]|nr:glycolate oxidase subunit GlcF [Alphaproteobacteria bacterium]